MLTRNRQAYLEPVLDSTDLVRFFKELDGTEMFSAQLAVEHKLMADYTKQIVDLPSQHSQLAMMYAELRGKLEAIKSLQSLRHQYINSQPSTALSKKEI